MVASAPRVDMGPGLPANCMPEMPDCDQPRRTSRWLCLCHRGWCGMQRPHQERLRPLPFFGLHVQAQRVCAHAETLPALTQVVGKKGESCIVDCSTMFPETKQSRRMAQQGRCGEAECAFAVAFRREVREPRSARSSALRRLLKACESQLKKQSACTMSGAPLLHFRAGTAGCTCGMENLRCGGGGGGSDTARWCVRVLVRGVQRA
jgi:hypothetical protein